MFLGLDIRRLVPRLITHEESGFKLLYDAMVCADCLIPILFTWLVMAW
jgi:hypothetical protein